jgi:hypothetical protein
MKVGSPLAKHVPVVLSALLVPQVANLPQLLVLLEPMPVEQQPFVIHVGQGNTMINQDKLPKLVANHVVQGNTMINQDKLPKLVANHVVQGNTMINQDNRVVHCVVLGNTTTS